MTEKLTPKKRKAVESLVANGDVSEAARYAGVSRDTLYRWLKQDDFRAALDAATRQALERLSRSLVALGDQAVGTLGSVMDDPDAATGVRLRAAEATISNILKLRELVSLESRVSELERTVQNGNKTTH